MRTTQEEKFGAGDEELFLRAMQFAKDWFLFGAIDGYSIEIGPGQFGGAYVTLRFDYDNENPTAREAAEKLHLVAIGC